ncbi:SEC14-like protein 5 [Seminavis robusta]|uniref:SEC14-like protein 5 n=1 Tax=Seminavis robusta TaxID=568900 RepID=A0A9N8DWQ6_9STRA|nr:SEC14-like protein 5 [Seminavis robusta]|eukprot:Sro330_g118890.1 SEC14-like protein 5 (410) ;mRNA; f:24818-26047
MAPFSGNSGRSSSLETEEEQPSSKKQITNAEDQDLLWSQANVTAVAELWELSEDEVDSLKKLQALLQDIDHWKNDPYEVVRYLREYGNVKKAETMFRKMVHWRVENDVDSFLDTYTPPILFRYLPVFLCQGLDRDGRPIYVERFGVGDQYGLVLAYGGIEPMAQYTQFVRELTTTRRRTPTGRFCWQRDYYEPLMGGKKRLTQFTAIMDMQDLNHRNLRGGLLGLLQRMARISQDCYAGVAKRVIILRAPAIFEWGWNSVVKHFFDEHIRKMITFTSAEDYLQVMDKYIDLEVLPDCLAPGIGKGKAMPGFFETVRLEGGLIPTEKEANKVHDTTRDHLEPLQEIFIPGRPQHPRNNHHTTASSSSSRVRVGSLLKGTWEVSSTATDDTDATDASIRSTSTEVTVYSGY